MALAGLIYEVVSQVRRSLGEVPLYIEYSLIGRWAYEILLGQTKKIICFQVAKRRIFGELGKNFLEIFFILFFF